MSKSKRKVCGKRSNEAIHQSKEILEDEYHHFADLLTKEHSTKMAQASAVNYFRRIFTENTEPPKYFDHSLIDTFIYIVRDESYAVDVRTDAAWAITNLLCSKRNPMTHIIIDKGALDTFVWCIETADSKLRDQCIWGVGNISADCSNCKEAVRSTDVLETIAHQIDKGAFISLESHRCAVWCCLNILRGGHQTLLPTTARQLLTSVTKIMRRYPKDGCIVQDSLLTLSLLADDRSFFNFPHLWPSQIDAMLNEPGLITNTLEAIGTAAPPTVSPALRLIGNIITGTDDQADRVVMRDGFIPLILKCLNMPVSQVRRESAWILSNIAAGPSHHVDLIIKDEPLIGKLLHLLHYDDARMKKEVCWVFANVLSSLNATNRATEMSHFLGYGVLSIVDFASKHGTDDRLVGKIREVLSALLVVHPEFWCVVERAGEGTTPLLSPPKRRKRAADYVIYDEDATEI